MLMQFCVRPCSGSQFAPSVLANILLYSSLVVFLSSRIRRAMKKFAARKRSRSKLKLEVDHDHNDKYQR
jgi:hypothetical protein